MDYCILCNCDLEQVLYKYVNTSKLHFCIITINIFLLYNIKIISGFMYRILKFFIELFACLCIFGDFCS